MFRVRLFALLLCLCALAGLAPAAMAAQVDCDAVYCFTGQDFAQADEPLAGICITRLPASQAGTVMLGNRVLRQGDILTAAQLEQLTFLPLRTLEDLEAQLCYLPIYDDRVETAATMTFSIRGKADKAPVAEDSAIETYKNLPNSGPLKATDPEGEALTYSLIRGPKRGQVELREDGTFLYTPKKNKVGVDSFVFTATDPAGNVSRQATVTVQILKPTDARQYQDTVGQDCRFEAEWLRNTGLFSGERVGGMLCFRPEETVSRGEFLTMAVKALDVPVKNVSWAAVPEDTPRWVKPYLAAAQRAGLMDGFPMETGSFCADQPITGAEAAVLLQNALDLTVGSEGLEVAATQELPDWAAASVTVMNAYHMDFAWDQPISRGQAAKVLYRASELAVTAPGTAVFRLQE